MPVRTERMPYTEEEADRLVQLYLLARETRRQDPIGSPKRAAGDEFVQFIAARRLEPTQHGEKPYTFYELASPLMVPDKNGVLKPMDQRKLRLYVGRRGGEGVKYPKSQERSAYQGVEKNPNLRTETHFSCKHWVDDDGNEYEEPDPGFPDDLREVFCERTEANTYIHRFTRKRKIDGVTKHYEVDICRRHSLWASAKYRQQRKKKNGGRKPRNGVRK